MSYFECLLSFLMALVLNVVLDNDAIGPEHLYWSKAGIRISVLTLGYTLPSQVWVDLRPSPVRVFISVKPKVDSLNLVLRVSATLKLRSIYEGKTPQDDDKQQKNK